MIAFADIREAQDRIRDFIYKTPCAHSETLSHLTGCNLYLKLENLQMTGSFKERGSLNKILQLNKQQKAVGVITASAGNHAQGVAHAAGLCGIRAVIVMPETTPLAKIQGTSQLGAEIELYGSSYDEAYEKACELQQCHGYTFIHAFDDPAVIAGQGTIGLELVEQVPDIDAVVVPVGGGGLISGIALAVKESHPDIDIIGVEAERLPAMQQSVTSGRVIPLRTANTIADGISVARVGEHTLPIVSKLVSQIVTVSEEEIAAAIMTLLEREKSLAEGAGAVGVAAMLQHRMSSLKGKTVVVVVSGGNIDMTLLARIIDRGLENDGRVSYVTVVVPDKPGSIAILATLAARHGANILHITQNRHASEVGLEESEVELTLETKGHNHVNEIIAELKKNGISVKSNNLD
ncbi:threonine ammonia-lyase [Solemya velum gill symbiont]|uniref:Threonine ammonia-lyase n=1 Tax=Solemya velum gill symbiont TaxID=2340 RepID=A0A1T2FGK9_SOVGS|nr:threonine ammonia-lyase [Solemya velum gill symbiont]OOY35628.1 threonine ammonia-lyase [Solemya velum gill symbiont]OOY38256.1 threonine ammonia-lyase [Solemya velum gill symbiont]OOY39064.1 threonine ammonia-lyase [Solemya velum gill symbiont]OOY42214.1 threonine ammonia-lyase [Solemya velum gill symbiont]OOY46985.1 threonine ammonia-lyase [Solemya velum gill symbiont]